MKRYFLESILIIFCVVVYFDYRDYKEETELYKSKIWLDFKRVQPLLDSNRTITDFIDTVSSNDKYYDFADFLKKVKVDFLILNDSIYFYSFGFDNKNDSLTLKYVINAKLNYFNSHFVKGDVLLYKGAVKLEDVKKKSYLNILGDDLPKITE